MNILAQVWKKWRAFGRAIGDLVGRVVMTLFYFTLAAPFGLGVRFLSDPLKLKPGKPEWEPRKTEAQTMNEARRSY